MSIVCLMTLALCFQLHFSYLILSPCYVKATFESVNKDYLTPERQPTARLSTVKVENPDDEPRQILYANPVTTATFISFLFFYFLSCEVGRMSTILFRFSLFTNFVAKHGYESWLWI